MSVEEGSEEVPDPGCSVLSGSHHPSLLASQILLKISSLLGGCADLSNSSARSLELSYLLCLFLIGLSSQAFLQETSVWSRHLLAARLLTVGSLGFGVFRPFSSVESYFKPLMTCEVKSQDV